MKEFYHASIAFKFLNGCDNKVLKSVKILCDGKKIPYASKEDGSYAFYNLDKGIHEFAISCRDFSSPVYKVDIQDDKFSEIIDTLYCSAKYARRYQKLKKIIVTITDKDGPIPNADVCVTQLTKVPYLRIVEAVEKDGDKIKLNGGFSTKLMYQHYTVNEEEPLKNDPALYFIGYDDKEDAYICNGKVENEIHEDTLLRPVWILPTDQEGMLSVPINSALINEEEVELKISYKQKSITVKAKTFGADQISVSF